MIRLVNELANILDTAGRRELDRTSNARVNSCFGAIWSSREGVEMRNGAPGGIRTPDHLVRSQVLYPTELPVLAGAVFSWRAVAPSSELDPVFRE